MGFKSDLATGQESEALVHSTLGGVQSQGQFKDYDLKIEVKRDVSAIKTGNVAIELSYKGEPSGWINGSDVLIYDVGGKLYSCYVDLLKRRLAINKEKYRIVMGGDGAHSQLVLIKLYWFLQIFNPINL